MAEKEAEKAASAQAAAEKAAADAKVIMLANMTPTVCVCLGSV